MEAHGLKSEELIFTDDGLRAVIRHYTREAGVRTLERELAKIARKSLRQILEGKTERIELTSDNVSDFLGVRRYRFGVGEEEDQIGAVTGLAWTEVGGELLTIEAVTVPGKGQIRTTGKLGEVMQESIQAAMSFVKARAPAFGVKPSIFARTDIHVHLPEGAVPKDGPSAGIGMVTAKNEKDLVDIPAAVKKQLEIVPVSHVDEVLARAMTQQMQPIEWTEADEHAAEPPLPGHSPDAESPLRH
jgi:ATP-dependent Lon protease